MIPLFCPSAYFGACLAHLSSIEWRQSFDAASESPGCECYILFPDHDGEGARSQLFFWHWAQKKPVSKWDARRRGQPELF
jgi:hypothetical protein